MGLKINLLLTAISVGPQLYNAFFGSWTSDLASFMQSMAPGRLSRDACYFVKMGGIYDDLKWEYRASHLRCESMSFGNPVPRVLEDYRKHVEETGLRDMQCVRVGVDTRWDGWVKVGPRHGFDEEMYCGLTLDFSERVCISEDGCRRPDSEEESKVESESKSEL